MDREQELKYKCNLSEETKQIAKDELREDEIIREQLLEQFRLWIKQNSLIKNCRTDPYFLLRFLRAKKFSLPMAQQMLERYLSIKTLYPEWFENLSVDEPNVQAIIDSGYMVPLLERDNNGRIVVLFNMGRLDPYKFTSTDVIRTHSLIFEALLEDEENQIRGFTYVMNESGMSMAHIGAWSFLDIRKLVYCVQNTVPMRHKHTYIVNVPTYGVRFFQICISYLNEKLKDRCTVLKDISELKDLIDLKYLPKESGGEVPYEDLIDSLKNTMEMRKKEIKTLSNMQIDITSTKSKFSYNSEIDDVSGSFRKLEVD